MDEAAPEHVEALTALGLRTDQFPTFLRGEIVVYAPPTEGQPGVAVLQKTSTRLRSGIVEIADPGGGGARTFLRFRGRSQRIAALFGLAELELFGAAVVNARLEQVLLSRGFVRRTGACPDQLGGGEMEILTRVFPLS